MLTIRWQVKSKYPSDNFFASRQFLSFSSFFFHFTFSTTKSRDITFYNSVQAAHSAGVAERAERRGRQAPEHLGRVRRAARTASAGRCGQKEVRRRHRLPRPRQHEHIDHVTSTATSRQPSITPTECITATTTMRITTCLDEWVIYSIGSKPSVTSHYTICSQLQRQ